LSDGRSGIGARYPYGHNLDLKECIYGDENEVFMYGLTNRPPAFANIPSFRQGDERNQVIGWSWDGTSMPYGGNSADDRGFRWGVVAYENPLTADEIYSFELKPLGKATSVQEVAGA
jgi:hypothetical protein